MTARGGEGSPIPHRVDGARILAACRPQPDPRFLMQDGGLRPFHLLTQAPFALLTQAPFAFLASDEASTKSSIIEWLESHDIPFTDV